MFNSTSIFVLLTFCTAASFLLLGVCNQSAINFNDDDDVQCDNDDGNL